MLSHELYYRRTKQSSAVLFLDTKQAYYRVVREAISCLHQGQDFDDCVLIVLRHFGMGPETWHALLALVQQGGALRSADVPEYYCALVEDLQNQAWFIQFSREIFIGSLKPARSRGQQEASTKPARDRQEPARDQQEARNQQEASKMLEASKKPARGQQESVCSRYHSRGHVDRESRWPSLLFLQQRFALLI